MFVTDELIQKALTQTTNWQTMIDKVWAAKVEYNLRKKSVFMPSLTVFDELLVPNSGDLIHVPMLPDLGLVPAIPEGTDMPINAMPDSKELQYVPTEYGMMYGVTRKMLDRIKYNGIGEIMDRFAYSVQQTLETQAASLFQATAPIVPADATATMQALYPNGKATGTIAPTDTFSDLDPNVRADLRFANPGFLMGDNASPNGTIASYHGVDIIVTNYVQTTTENGVTVYNALLVSPRWAAIAWKRRPEAVIDPTLYDLGRRRQMGITADFQLNLLHSERSICLKSA
jgi:hypothetical protein